MSVKLSPSILAADLTRLGEQVKEAESAGADWLHVDVMDGRFTPTITVGTPIVAALRRITSLPIDVHLLTIEPERLIPAFAAAGADRITVQVEACTHLHNTIHQIKNLGLKAGVALTPGSPLSSIKCLVDDVDSVLLLTADIGFDGASPYANSVKKVARLCNMLTSFGLDQVEVQVDGGVDVDNIADYAAAGATVFVVETAVFNPKTSITTAIANLRTLLEEQEK